MLFNEGSSYRWVRCWGSVRPRPLAPRARAWVRAPCMRGSLREPLSSPLGGEVWSSRRRAARGWLAICGVSPAALLRAFAYASANGIGEDLGTVHPPFLCSRGNVARARVCGFVIHKESLPPCVCGVESRLSAASTPTRTWVLPRWRPLRRRTRLPMLPAPCRAGSRQSRASR